MAGGMSTLLVTSTAAKPNPLDRSVVALAPSPVFRKTEHAIALY